MIFGELRRALLARAPAERDAHVDRLLRLQTIPEDGPELPRGAVPYLPCPIDALIRAVEYAPIAPGDLVVDVGSGVGRAAIALHWLSGAATLGVEIQPRLAAMHEDAVARLGLSSRCEVLCADATREIARIAHADVFFFYCPFSGDRLAAFVDALEPLVAGREVRFCCLDVDLPARPWLTRVPLPFEDLAIYRSSTTRR